MSGIEAQPFIYIKLSSRKIKNPLNFSESNLLNYEILPKSNILLASSSNSFKVSVKCHSIFTEKQTTKEIKEMLCDSKSQIISTLLKGINITMMSFGKCLSGKTSLLFGKDSKFNEIEHNSNIINNIFNFFNQNNEENSYIFNLQCAEIRYESENTEKIVDLLENSVQQDLNELLSISFKNKEQLSIIINEARFKSLNWISNNNEVRFIPNVAHSITILNIFSLKTKKNVSFKLIDLIGLNINDENKKGQLSIINIMNFMKEIKNNSENGKNLIKKMKKGFINFLFSSFFNSQTVFLSIFQLGNDYLNDSKEIICKLQEISNIKYNIDKSFLNNPKKIVNFNSFYENSENKYEEKEDNKKNVNEIINSELKNIYSKIDNINSKINFSDIAEESDEGSTSKRSPASKKNNSSEKKNSSKNCFSKDEELIPESLEIEPQINEKFNQRNSDSVYETYDRKVRNIIGSLRNFKIPDEEPSLNDFDDLRRNYDLLMNIFEEGEDIRRNLMLQFVELKDNLIEFKTEFDLKLQDEKLKNMELQKKMRLIQKDSNIEQIVISYENELEKLRENLSKITKENDCLYKDFFDNQNSNHTEIISNMRNFLLKNNRNLTLKLKEKDDEISELKKKERQFLSSNKMLNNLNKKTSNFAKIINEKESQEKKTVEICKILESENENLKRNFNDLQKNFKNLSEEYFKNKEQLFLFKEMAKSPNDFFVNQIKKNSPKKNEKIEILEKGFSGKKNKKIEREKIFEKLKSLMD